MSEEMEVQGEDWHGMQEGADIKSQSEMIAPYQVMNSTGGYVYETDHETRLMRFLSLGVEGGTYYTGEKELKRENAQVIDRLIMTGKGEKAVKIIREFSVAGRTAKQDTIIFALALCCRSNDAKTKEAAYKALPDVCRIPTHLFQFIKFCEEESGTGTGWGRAHRKGINRWYNGYKDKPDGYRLLVLHATKYKARHGWSHKDVIRLGHVKPVDHVLTYILSWIVKGPKKTKEIHSYMFNRPDFEQTLKAAINLLEATEKAIKCTKEDEMTKLIIDHNLTREHVPTELLKSKEIWLALLRHMPMTAMIRNLGKMTSLNLLEVGSFGEELVVQKLNDELLLKKARIHPFNMLVALYQYQKGQGELGKLKWTTNHNVAQALEEGFYKSFKFSESTKKRFLLAVDVSGSMNVPVIGTPTISARDAAAAMMMVTARNEANFEIVAFSGNLQKLEIAATDSLDLVLSKTSFLPFCGTDCSKPMLYAIEKKKKFDVFVVYTDSETYHGSMHPSDALRKYRSASGINDARLIVCGMASTGFTIADPHDPFMLDVVGFDSHAPDIMTDFVMGRI